MLFLGWFVFRLCVRPAMPLGEKGRHALTVLVPPIPIPAVHVAHSHPSVPEQGPHAAKGQEQQEQRHQAAKHAKSKPEEGMPEAHIGYRRDRAGGNRQLLRYSLNHAEVVGISTDPNDGSDQHQCSQDSPKYSHFLISFFIILISIEI
jgi:hypothetical protein